MIDEDKVKLVNEEVKKYKKDIEICIDLAEQLVKQINKVNSKDIRTSILFSILLYLSRNVDIPCYDALLVTDVLHARLMREIVDLQLGYIKRKLK